MGPSALTPAAITRRTTRAAFDAGSSSSTDFSPAVFGIHGTNVVSPSSAVGLAGFFAAVRDGTATEVTDARSAATPRKDSTAATGSGTGVAIGSGAEST